MNRTRTFSWEDPAIGAQQALTLSGLEYIQAMKDGSLPKPPIMNTLDFQLKSIESGKAVFSFTPFEFHYNPIGTVHGGVITTVLDSALGCAVHSLLPAGKAYTTLELKVNFIKAITKDSGELMAIGKVIHAGTKTALVEAQVIDFKNKVYAHSVSTCLLFDINL
jgi:uncharacterized protein (TIGR00369 family)